MAYVTGTANSLADLLAAIQSACTANGWTLAGNILVKGTCYVRVIISGTQLQVIAGTGKDGSNNLTGAANDLACILGRSTTNAPFGFPATYYIHVNTAPDEVYVVVNYATLYYQFLAFGQSAMPGLAGTGNWYTGSQNTTFSGTVSDDTTLQNGGMVDVDPVVGLFQGRQYAGNRQNGAVDHELDSVTWQVEGAWRDWYSPFVVSPNAFNSRSILLPVRVYAPRPSGFVSPVLECAHARFVNIANLDAQQIITLGTDKWKVYPWWSKTNGGAIAACGHAFRYDGP